MLDEDKTFKEEWKQSTRSYCHHRRNARIKVLRQRFPGRSEMEIQGLIQENYKQFRDRHHGWGHRHGHRHGRMLGVTIRAKAPEEKKPAAKRAEAKAPSKQPAPKAPEAKVANVDQMKRQAIEKIMERPSRGGGNRGHYRTQRDPRDREIRIIQRVNDAVHELQAQGTTITLDAIIKKYDELKMNQREARGSRKGGRGSHKAGGKGSGKGHHHQHGQPRQHHHRHKHRHHGSQSI